MENCLTRNNGKTRAKSGSRLNNLQQISDSARSKSLFIPMIAVNISLPSNVTRYQNKK